MSEHVIERELDCGCEVTLTVAVTVGEDGKVDDVEPSGRARISYCVEHGYPEADDMTDTARLLEPLIEGMHQLSCPNWHTYGDFSPMAKTGPREPCDCFAETARTAQAALEAV